MKQTHDDMVQAAHYWVENAGKCAFAFAEMHSTTSEIPDVLGFRDSGHTSILIECKASRSDFLTDKKKRFRIIPEMGMGKYRFYCCPTGMIKKEELPEKWGLIYVGKTGHPRAVVNPMKPSYPGKSTFTDRHIEGERQMMYTALRFTELGVDLEKAVYIGRVINQLNWGYCKKMPKYIPEIAKRMGRKEKELTEWINYLISLL